MKSCLLTNLKTTKLEQYLNLILDFDILMIFQFNFNLNKTLMLFIYSILKNSRFQSIFIRKSNFFFPI